MQSLLDKFEIEKVNSGVYGRDWIEKPGGEVITSYNPTTGEPLAEIVCADENDYETVMQHAQEAFETWRMMPAPKRGEVIREMGNALRDHCEDLGHLVSLEMGKIAAEGIGEVQEMIDIADFSVGLSRQLYGLTMHSERPYHRMYEQWHPLGVVGIISAFNFPVAVWSWNAMLAAVCGNTMLWKPSEKTPLCAIAVQKIISNVLKKHNVMGIMGLVTGSRDPIGEKLIHDPRIPLVSATGSTRMGKRVGEVVHQRLGKTILELGGNNALIVMDDADMDLALRAVLFGAVGTAGQRCTSTRRLFLQENIADEFLQKLAQSYEQIPIGDPLDEKTLMGPLIDQDSVDAMKASIQQAVAQGGKVICEAGQMQGQFAGNFVKPVVIEATHGMEIVKHETFAPILYALKFKDIEEAVKMQNDVPQGLSSAIFTKNVLHSEYFLSHLGSDCGIANVNIGTSGAEIGGAFGGEKETGGGREAGSDSWKAYMRRQTNTINWGKELPLAQGIEFG